MSEELKKEWDKIEKTTCNKHGNCFVAYCDDCLIAKTHALKGNAKTDELTELVNAQFRGKKLFRDLSWEEQFDKDFQFDGVTLKGNRHWKDGVKQNLVKQYIRKILAKQQEEFVKKIKGMLMDDSNHNDYYYGYNDALNDLLEDFADIKSKLK